MKIIDSANSNLVSNFIRQIIEEDLASGKRTQIVTRFPPEPNGYLHIGHAKSIHINFGFATDYAKNGAKCHLRFDDTNPSTEDEEYEKSIIEVVRWLGFDFGTNLYYASAYFDKFYECATALIKKGLAYVDEQSAEQLRSSRGTLTEVGKDSPHRNRQVAENLELFTKMKNGEYADGTMVLRAKIDMSSPNINLRDPAIYRIRHQHHFRTGDCWVIYPMYDFAHCISDAIEGISHSICTLEFEDHRPLYEWFLNNLCEFFPKPHPQQIEFARLKINHTITSKRKLLTLIKENRVSGWDDPRLPTIVGLRRRGYTPNAIAKFCERIGVSKADSTIDMGILEDCLREDLNENALRKIAILKPIKLIIENYPVDKFEIVHAPNHPQKPELGYRELHFCRELWIDSADFQEFPEQGFHRLKIDGEVRLRYGYIIKCTRIEKDALGNISTIIAEYDSNTKSGSTPSNPALSVKKVKGNIHWLSSIDAQPATARIYQRLFTIPEPDRVDNINLVINENSIEMINILVEPSLYNCQAEDKIQFERTGYFCADRYEYKPGSAEGAIFNLAVTLRSNF